MKKLKIALPGAILGFALMFSSSVSFAKPEFMKKEKGSKCVTCHVSAKSKDLNDTGKCYQKDHDLAKCSAK